MSTIQYLIAFDFDSKKHNNTLSIISKAVFYIFFSSGLSVGKNRIVNDYKNEC